MYDEDLTNLEDWLRRLKVEYDVFFNGHRKRPPEDLKMRVEKLVKRLSDAGNMNYSQRFRYNTLVTRFYVLRDLWRRTLAERELGTSPKGEEAPFSGQPGSPAAPKAASRETEVHVSVTDPDKEEGKIRELYSALVRLRGRHAKDSASISYAQFAKYIAGQTQGIQRKYRCSNVVFTISQQDDAIKLTARAEGHPME